MHPKEFAISVIYASQKGNSQAIAEDLYEQCLLHGIPGTLYSIDTLGKDPSLLLKQHTAIFIASTTGDGEPPDTARKWWRSLHKRAGKVAVIQSISRDKSDSCLENGVLKEQTYSLNEQTHFTTDTTKQNNSHKLDATETVDFTLRSKTTPDESNVLNLSSLSYTVLGLGDTNYTNFCNFGKNLDQKLYQLGAQRFYACGWADDGTGLDIVIEPWLQGLWGALQVHLTSMKTNLHNDNNKDHDGDSCEIMDGHINNNNMIGKDCKDGTRGHSDCLFLVKALNAFDLSSQLLKADNSSGSAINLDMANTTNIENVTSSNEVTSTKHSDLNGVNNSRTVENLKDGAQFVISVDTVEPSIHMMNSKIAEVVSDGLASLNLSVDSHRRCNESDLIDYEWRKNHPLLQLCLPEDDKLTVPKIPSCDSICVHFDDELYVKSDDVFENGTFFPSAAGPIHVCSILEVRRLSIPEPDKEVKKCTELVLQLPADAVFEYEPGDTVGVVVRNCADEVNLVLSLLGIAEPDNMCRLTQSLSSKKSLPLYLPKCSSPRELLSSCLDFHCIPKKAAMLQLLRCATDPYERRCLQELVSREGAKLYSSKVLEARMTFLDLLTVFRSARPNLDTLVQILPRLLPRPYSLTSSPLRGDRKISFAYNLTVIPNSNLVYSARYGVCTGALDTLQESVTVTSIPRVRLYLRTSTTFCLPADPCTPLILVGPGTGVAPLVGFLRHRLLLIDTGQLTPDQIGTSWLFFGCRYSGADELYRDELQEFLCRGVLTHLRVCYSRETRNTAVDNKNSVGEMKTNNESESNHQVDIITSTNDRISDASVTPCYVQELILREGPALCTAITDQQAVVMVCGDASRMASAVRAAVVAIVGKGDEYVTSMQADGRYRQDVWT